MSRHFRFVAAAGLAAACPALAQYSLVTNLPGAFTDISATGTVVTTGDDSSWPFTSGVTNALVPTANLYGCTNGNVTDQLFFEWENTELPVPGPTTMGLFVLWDDLVAEESEGASFKHQMLAQGGVNVEVVQWTNVRTYDAGPGGPQGTFQLKIFASGPVLAQFIYQSTAFAGNGISATVGVQWGGSNFRQFSFDTASVAAGMVISVIAGEPGPVCYPNCDGSTTQPCLNVADFGCFLNRFGAGDTYANCDGSTTPPVLNVADFGCFLNRFGAGCTGC